MQGAHQTATTTQGHGRLIQAFRKINGDEHVLLAASAAWALGAPFADDDEPVAVGIGSHHRLRRRSEVVTHLARLDVDEVVPTPLGLSTTAARAAFDLARGIGMPVPVLADRVARVDALLNGTGLRADDARRAGADHRGLKGVRTAQDVLALCRDGVHSPPETALRLMVVAGGLPEPLTQCPVVLDGRTVARLDLGWPEHLVGCEYDGRVHGESDQLRKDLRRHNLVREAGWTVLQVDRHQARRPDEVLRQLRRLLG
ncbi:hypothetical protein [Aquipuribacter sp. MA13-6]|uniref:hypothetical protein n=1 Tax=unclassified Aquipuribacter TaxID=2635084 RepID=UPI003EEB7954